MNNKLQDKVNKIIQLKSEQLDAQRSAQLNQARNHAIDGKSQTFLPKFFYVPAAASVLIGLYLFMAVFNSQSTLGSQHPKNLQNSQNSQVVSTDNDLIVIEQLNTLENMDDIELLDDLEFYQWLNDEQNNQI